MSELHYHTLTAVSRRSRYFRLEAFPVNKARNSKARLSEPFSRAKFAVQIGGAETLRLLCALTSPVNV